MGSCAMWWEIFSPFERSIFCLSFEYISFVNWKLNYWFTCARLCGSMEAVMCSLCVRARDRALEHGAGQNIIHLMNINVDSTRFLYLSCLFLFFFRRCIIKSIIEISFSAFESLFIEFIESRWRRRIHTWWMLGEDCLWNACKGISELFLFFV